MSARLSHLGEFRLLTSCAASSLLLGSWVKQDSCKKCFCRIHEKGRWLIPIVLSIALPSLAQIDYRGLRTSGA
eukprot:4139429-Amphidinium_carterae.1